MSKLVFATLWGLAAAIVNWYLREKTSLDIEETHFPSLAPFSVLGVAISLFLSFRTNACYNRWWEARTEWGMQYNTTRNLTRIVCSMLSPKLTLQSNEKNGSIDPVLPLDEFDSVATSRKIAKLGVAHSHALRSQLRKTWFAGRLEEMGATVREANDDRDRFLEAEDMARITASNNPALVILHVAGEQVGKLLQQGYLDSIGAVAINEQLKVLCNTQGAAERIANTLIPHSYSLLVYRTIVFYVIISPWAMVNAVQWYTPLFNLVIAYAFFGIHEVARQIEQPYGDEPNSLALDAICRSIEMGYFDVYGDVVPPPLKPDKNCRLR